MANPTGIDKRKFKRLDVALDVDVRIEAVEGASTGLPESLRATCRNLSLQGLCLETSCLADGAARLLSGRPGEREYNLLLEILLEQDCPLEARGEVCWYNLDHAALNFIYQIGIEFVDLTPQSRSRLKRFIRTHCRSGGLVLRIKNFFSSR